MSSEELKKRQKRAESEPLVIAATEAGFRVHSPLSSGGPYRVTGVPDAPACTCPDFERHRTDPEWRCKHVLAVLNSRRTGVEREGPQAPEPQSTHPRTRAKEPRPDETNSGDGTSRMVLKRSVSPDGRIDSLSVELSTPVEGRTAEDITAGAAAILKIQDRIASRFLAGANNGVAATERQPRARHRPSSREPVTVMLSTTRRSLPSWWGSAAPTASGAAGST